MIEWIVTSSALILLILLLRILIKNRVSPRLRYALWGLALLRLLVPGTLWESPASVMTPVAAQEVYQEIERIPRYVRAQPDGWLEIGHENGWTSIPLERVETGETVQYGWPERTEASVEDLQRQVDIRDAFVWTWLAGTAVMGAFLLAVNLKFASGLRKRRRTAGKYRGRWVFVVDGLATPCLAGLLRPSICLTPEVTADERAREHVLAHEYTHFRQGDHVWAVLRGVCLAVHWYNPLVWLAAYLSRRDCELSCDEGAVRLLGEDCRADYGRTLVGLVARRTTPKDLACCATTMTGGKSALKERIALLVKRPRTTAAMACLVAAACLVFAACTFTGAAEKSEPSEPPQAETQEPEETLPQPPAAPMSRENLTAMTQRLMEEQLLSREGVLSCRVNWVNVVEWRYDINSGDQQAAFGAEMMVQASPGYEEHWLAGNGVYAGELEDGFYRDYDGWIVFWWTGYLTYDRASGEGSIPATGTGGGNLDDIDSDLGLSAEGRDYRYFHAPPEELPTELMDLERPAAEQGEWLLLAQTPGFDIALYRHAWDDQHVYLRVTNMSFQRFDRDLSGMELLPMMEVVDGDADITVQVLYRRYEGTYFDGTSYEPGIVADQMMYGWNEAGRYWTEWTVMTQPGLYLTENLPALADLPGRLVRPGTPEAEADMWLIGELPGDGISAYYEQSSDRYWLRYGDDIQAVEGMTVCLPQIELPELYWTDLDGDGEKELTVISCAAAGTGVAQEQLSVYAWDGGRWTGQTFDSDWLINSFNAKLDYQLYDDGTVYIRNSFIEAYLLLDLSELWESGYWNSPPDFCGLSDLQVSYSLQDGQFVLTLGGELLDSGGPYLHGHVFDYTCPVVYTDCFDYFECWFGVLRSDFAIEPQLPELTDGYRTLLRSLLAMSDPNYTNVFAVHDVDGDGREELIVRWMPEGGMASAWGTSVYNAKGNEQFHGYGELTFYDNGVISVPWSHNQGPACAIWPYDLYHLNSNGGGYTLAGSARARSNEIEGFASVAYADLDGDGMVYYIGEDAYTEENPVDNAVYEAWLAQHLGGAKILPIQYFPLTEDVIS